MLVRLFCQADQKPIFEKRFHFLSFSQIPLRRSGINFVRLDGAMTRLSRELSLSKFDTDPDVTVFLVSLKCGGLGLNLTAGSQVFMVWCHLQTKIFPSSLFSLV